MLFWLCCKPHNASLKCCHWVSMHSLGFVVCCLCCGQLFVVLFRQLTGGRLWSPFQGAVSLATLMNVLNVSVHCWQAALCCNSSRAVVWPVESYQNGMSSSVYRSTRIKRPWPSGPRQNCLCNWLIFCEVFLATTRHHINICAQTDCCYERSGLEMVGFCDLVFKENVSGDWPYKGSTSQYWGVLGGCQGVVNLLCSWYTVKICFKCSGQFLSGYYP